MTSLHSSSGYSSIATLGPRRPALLTSTSILPKRSTVSLTILSTSAPFDTSAERAKTSAPVSSTSSATGPIDSSLRALIATLAPSRAKASASALPRPWLAPVIITTLPSSISLQASISASRLESRRLISTNRSAFLRQELQDVLGYGAHLTPLIDDLDIGARPQVLLVDLGDGVSDRDRVTDKDRSCKPDAIVA